MVKLLTRAPREGLPSPHSNTSLFRSHVDMERYRLRSAGSSAVRTSGAGCFSSRRGRVRNRLGCTFEWNGANSESLPRDIVQEEDRAGSSARSSDTASPKFEGVSGTLLGLSSTMPHKC